MDYRALFMKLYEDAAACEAPEGTQLDDVLAAHQDAYNKASEEVAR